VTESPGDSWTRSERIAAVALIPAAAVVVLMLAKSTGAVVLGLLFVAISGATAWAALQARPGWERRLYWGFCILLGVASLGTGLIDYNNSTNTASAPSSLTSSSNTTAPTTTTPPMTTPTSTLPTPAGPPLPPEEQVINESKSAEFFDGALLLANQSTYSSYVALTITTDSTSCTSSYLDVGERAVIAANDAGNRFFRVTVLETDPDASARLRVEDLPQENWPARSPSCPI
jgi:hypothetical protein